MDCNEEKCLWVGEASASGPRVDEVHILAYSPAGNPNRLHTTIETFGVLTGEPEYWGTSVTCAPGLVDRHTASLIGYKVYCNIELTNTDDSFYPIKMDFGGFRGCNEAIGQYVSKIDLLNKDSQTRYPVFSMTLFKQDITADNVTLNCPITIYTAKEGDLGGMVNPNPETESVNMTLTFYNDPLSNIYKNLDDQVQKSIKDAQDNMKFIAKLQKFFSMIEKLCNIKNVIANVLGSVRVVSYFFSHLDDVYPPLDPAKAKIRSTRLTMCAASDAGANAHKRMLPGLDRFCNFINCRASQKDQGGKGFLYDAGGAAPWCGAVKAALTNLIPVKDVPNIDIRNTVKLDSTYSQNFDVKNSLILSTICLCLPGIIHNLNKLRQIKCQKALCMKREVRDNGLPPSVCNDIEGYLMCTFVIGDIFNLIPAFRVFSQFSNLLADIFSNPWTLMPLMLGLKCKGMCEAPAASGKYKICTFPLLLAKLGDALASVKGIKDLDKLMDMSPASGACEQLDKIVEKQQ